MAFASSDDLFGLSPYIVDNTNPTYYQTIGVAISQAVVDGHNAGNPAVIFIKSGTYTENVIMASGVYLEGVSPVDDFFPSVTISGSVTVTQASGDFYAIKNIAINNPTGNSLILTGTFPLRFVATDCNINITAANAWGVDLNCASGTFGFAVFTECLITGDDYAINAINRNSLVLTECRLFSNNIACINASNTCRISANISVIGTNNTINSIILNNSTVATINYSDVSGAVLCNDTSSATLNYCPIDSGSTEAFTIAAGATCRVIMNIVNSSAASTFWATGTGAIATGGNNSLIGSAGTIDPSLSLTGYFMG